MKQDEISRDKSMYLPIIDFELLPPSIVSNLMLSLQFVLLLWFCSRHKNKISRVIIMTEKAAQMADKRRVPISKNIVSTDDSDVHARHRHLSKLFYVWFFKE